MELDPICGTDRLANGRILAPESLHELDPAKSLLDRMYPDRRCD